MWCRLKSNCIQPRCFVKKLVLLFCCLLSSFISFNCVSATPKPASEVFVAQTKVSDPNAFVIYLKILPGYFLYRDRIHVAAKDSNDLSLNILHFPEPLTKMDKQGRKVLVYRDLLTLAVSVLGKHPGTTQVALEYQGCSDEGFCYPPIKQAIQLKFDDTRNLVSAELPNTDKKPLASEASQSSSPHALELVFVNHHWFMILLIFFGFGLLLSFTPCVLPMVPVLSGIIVGHGHAISTRKAFFLSLTYVGAMAMTYALVGAIVAMLGANLQIIMQSPWAISFFSFVFVLLSLSMFGFFELKLPESWQRNLALVNRSQASGHYLSVAVMGALSTLILSPCVTAPLIGALSYIAHTGNIFLGASTLFFLGLGMGMPLLLIGTSARHWLPKTGHWMNAVKFFFGIMLLAVAIFLMSRILPDVVTMVLWATLLIFSGIYAGALVPAYDHHEKFKQAAGLLMLAYGLLILTGASMGGTNPLQPLHRSKLDELSKAIPLLEKNATVTLTSLDQVKEALAKAKGKAVILDFYADWCDTCKKIASHVLTQPRLKDAMGNVITLKVDVTANNAHSQELLHYFKVIAPPTFLFFDKAGEELSDLRLAGMLNVTDFLTNIRALEE